MLERCELGASFEHRGHAARTRLRGDSFAAFASRRFNDLEVHATAIERH